MAGTASSRFPYSLFDAGPHVTFERFERGQALRTTLQGIDGVQRIAAFSKGFYKLHAEGTRLFATDLRMGQEPAYIFTFAVGSSTAPCGRWCRPSSWAQGRACLAACGGCGGGLRRALPPPR